MKQADGVRPAADAGDQCIRQPALGLEDLLLRLAADDRLEIAHQHRIRMRPRGRADHIERRRDIGYPIAQRFVHRILQRARARRHRHDLRAEQLHAEHVGLLPLDIGLAHENHAWQAEPRAYCCGGDPVLPRARLGDDAGLAHPPRKKNLADAVVDLVRAGVVELVALEVDFRPAEMFGQPLGEIHRRRPSDIVLQQPVELFPELRVFLGARIFLLEVEHQRHQRLGDETPAELAETSVGVGPLVPGVGAGLYVHGAPIEPSAAPGKSARLARLLRAMIVL